jgi:hypothetical protein
LLRTLGEITMYEVYRHGTFADCRSDAFYASRSCVADSKYPRDAGFEHERRTI